MIVIVGHGPSAKWTDGSWLDYQVVFLKGAYGNQRRRLSVPDGFVPNYMCTRNLLYTGGYDVPVWLYPYWDDPKDYARKNPNIWVADRPKWEAHWSRFRQPGYGKPSTGLCAIYCAVEKGFDDIGLIGFDSFFGGEWATKHNGTAERNAAESIASIRNLSCLS